MHRDKNLRLFEEYLEDLELLVLIQYPAAHFSIPGSPLFYTG
jgi:hypothetical protein